MSLPSQVPTSASATHRSPLLRQRGCPPAVSSPHVSMLLAHTYLRRALISSSSSIHSTVAGSWLVRPSAVARSCGLSLFFFCLPPTHLSGRRTASLAWRLAWRHPPWLPALLVPPPTGRPHTVHRALSPTCLAPRASRLAPRASVRCTRVAIWRPGVSMQCPSVQLAIRAQDTLAAR